MVHTGQIPQGFDPGHMPLDGPQSWFCIQIDQISEAEAAGRRQNSVNGKYLQPATVREDEWRC